jgi:hypothetical protein
MIVALARKLFGSSNEPRIKRYMPRVAQINALEKDLEKLSDDALRARTEAFKKRVADGAASRAAAERAPYKGATRTLVPAAMTGPIVARCDPAYLVAERNTDAGHGFRADTPAFAPASVDRGGCRDSARRNRGALGPLRHGGILRNDRRRARRLPVKACGGE